MRLRTPVLALALLVPLLSSGQAAADGSVAVSEAGFQAWLSFEYEGHLRKARIEQDGANRARHEASYQAAVKATGLNASRAAAVERALLDVDDAVLRFEQGQMTKEEFDAYLAGLHPQTVATARKHESELRGDRGYQRAKEQARQGIVDARKGELVTQVDLQGLWVVDVETTFRGLLGAMADAPEMAGVRAELEKSLEGGMSYEFKGNRVLATLGQGKKQHVTESTYRIEGRMLTFEQAHSMGDIEVGMKDGRLILGVGMTSVVYKRKR